MRFRIIQFEDGRLALDAQDDDARKVVRIIHSNGESLTAIRWNYADDEERELLNCDCPACGGQRAAMGMSNLIDVSGTIGPPQ